MRTIISRVMLRLESCSNIISQFATIALNSDLVEMLQRARSQAAEPLSLTLAIDGEKLRFISATGPLATALNGEPINVTTVVANEGLGNEWVDLEVLTPNPDDANLLVIAKSLPEPACEESLQSPA